MIQVTNDFTNFIADNTIEQTKNRLDGVTLGKKLILLVDLFLVDL